MLWLNIYFPISPPCSLCTNDKYFLISLWQFYTVMVQSLSQGLKPSIMGPSILIVGLGRGGLGVLSVKHTRFSHLSQNKWAAPLPSASLIWMKELLGNSTTLISTPMESVRYSCSWWNTSPGDATLPPQMIPPCRTKAVSDERTMLGTPVSSVVCIQKKPRSIRSCSAVVKNCNTWVSYFQIVSKTISYAKTRKRIAVLYFW